MKILVNLVLMLLVVSCVNDSKKETEVSKNKAQLMIDDLIKNYGGDKYLNMKLEYDFRDIHYIAKREGGSFSYERIIGDSIHDILNNGGFSRKINDQKAVLVDSMSAKYARSVNSVHYFTLLPYGLNDPAVNKKYIGTSTIEGNSYHKIHVSFDSEGGGEDHQDDFIYFINTETGSMDYFGYIYETDGGGGRFRKAYNKRIVGDITFQDYINYKPKDPDDTYSFMEFDSLFSNGGMIELSRIELKNIQVSKFTMN